MAITHRLYRTERAPNGRGGWMAALSPYITERCFDELGNLIPEEQRSCFSHWSMVPNFDFYYCHAWCESAVHAQCEADPLITPLTGEFSSQEALQAFLGGTIGGDLSTLIDVAEGDGIPLDGLSGASTFGEFMRRIARHHYVTQSIYDSAHKPAVLLMQKTIALTHRRNQVPPLVREKRLAKLTGRLVTEDINALAELDWIEINAELDFWMEEHEIKNPPGRNVAMREFRHRAATEAKLDVHRWAMKLHKLAI